MQTFTVRFNLGTIRFSTLDTSGFGDPPDCLLRELIAHVMLHHLASYCTLPRIVLLARFEQKGNLIMDVSYLNDVQLPHFPFFVVSTSSEPTSELCVASEINSSKLRYESHNDRRVLRSAEYQNSRDLPALNQYFSEQLMQLMSQSIIDHIAARPNELIQLSGLFFFLNEAKPFSVTGHRERLAVRQFRLAAERYEGGLCQFWLATGINLKGGFLKQKLFLLLCFLRMNQGSRADLMSCGPARSTFFGFLFPSAKGASFQGSVRSCEDSTLYEGAKKAVG